MRQRRLLWLVPVVLCAAVGAWFALRPPPPVPEPPPSAPEAHLADVTGRAGIRFRHASGATGRKLLPETMGSGVAVLDFDRDGRPDLFFVNSRPWPGEPNAPRATQALYRNRGGTFEDATAAAGLDVELYGLGCAVGDYDGDGWPDLFVTALGGNRLFRNVDGKTFADVTDASGLGSGWKWPTGSNAEFLTRAAPIDFPSSATFLDYDGDGKPDLFVCYYVEWSPAFDLGVVAVLPGGGRAYVPPQQFGGAHCRLYRNTGGRFEDVSAAAGVRVFDSPEPGRGKAVGKALGVVVDDFDGDGWPDVVVANDTVRNFFFHNQPDSSGGRVFRENALFAGIATADGRPRGGMGVDAADILPGVRAVAVANFTNEPNSLFRRVSTSPLRFVDVAAEAEMSAPTRAAMKFGTVFGDFDRDGRADLFTANGHLEPDIAASQPGQSHAQPALLLKNAEGPKARFVAAGGQFPPMVGRGCATIDYDGDGRLDVVVTANGGAARLFRNESPDSNGYVRFVTAPGAEVTVEAGGLAQRRYITGSRGYLSVSDTAAHFGLNGAAKVDRVRVRWPGRAGRVQEWRDLGANATYRLTAGASGAEKLD